jgi:ornithine cyclodeaminase/alanine dehydrogenase-like protein (mu-crystallin family)
LFAPHTGELLCTGDASEITHIRTAAASAVATRALARPVDSIASALAAAAEFLAAREAGLIDEGHILSEIGEVLAGLVEGR